MAFTRTSTMNCTIRNLSSSGALVLFADPAPIPEEFELTIPHRAETLRARRMWRKAGQAGLCFVTPEAEPSSSARSLGTGRAGAPA